jgi:transcriptional regulator with XRE-family HTH domain
MSISNQILINRIKSLRKSRGITQIEMAESIGVSKSTYNRIELGDTPIYDDRLNQILKTLRISLFEIIFAFELDINEIIQQDELDLATVRDLIKDQIKLNQKILKVLDLKLQKH